MKQILKYVETISILGTQCEARIDTGAKGCAIDTELVRNLRRATGKPIRVRQANGTSVRPTLRLTFTLGGIEQTQTFSVINRAPMSYPVLIGRSALQDFLVDSEPIEPPITVLFTEAEFQLLGEIVNRIPGFRDRPEFKQLREKISNA